MMYINAKERISKMKIIDFLNKTLSISAIRKIIYLLCIIIIIVCAGIVVKTSIQNNSRHASDTGTYFDTVVSIEIYDSASESSAKSLIKTCFDMCKTYDEMFDMYSEDSEIYQINSADGLHSTVSEETIGIINVGKYFSKLTDGAFDITIGSVSELWDFNSSDPEVPDDEAVSEALSAVDYTSIILYYDINEVLLGNADAKIDVGAIVKGYVSNEIKEYLVTQGVTSAMINLGGNIETIGSKTDGSDFSIGIQKPFADDGETIATVDISDLSVVTAGVYQRYFYDDDDNFYSHLLSTETGYPIDNDLLSVTVISTSGLDGDGLSTSAMLLGLEDGMKLVEEYINAEAIFITSDYEIVLTSGLTQDADGTIQVTPFY